MRKILALWGISLAGLICGCGLGTAGQGYYKGNSVAVDPLSKIPKAGCLYGAMLPNVSGNSVPDFCGSAGVGTILNAPPVSDRGLALNVGDCGKQQALQLPAVASAAQTFVVYGFFPPFGASYGYGFGDASGHCLNPSLFFGTSPNLLGIDGYEAEYRTGPRASSWLLDQLPSSTGSQPTEALPFGWHVVTYVCSTQRSSGSQVYYDGRPVTMSGGGGISCPTNTATGVYQVGGSRLGTDTFGNYILTGTLVYSKQLDAASVATISDALHSYGRSVGAEQDRPLSTPSHHPALLVADGDSRTAGVACAGCDWPSSLRLDDANTQVVNRGFGGATAQDLCADRENWWNAGYQDASSPALMAAVWMGVNDYAVYGPNPATVATSTFVFEQQMCSVERLKKLGYHVFLATEIAGSGSAYDLAKNTITPMMRQQYATDAAVTLVDLATFPCLGADGASNRSNPGGCFVEQSSGAAGLHPNTVAEQGAIAGMFANAINEWRGATCAKPNETAAASYAEQARDGCVKLTGAAAQVITLPDCQGYSKTRTIVNASNNNATVQAAIAGWGSSFVELIDGRQAVTLAANTTVKLQPLPSAMATGGCSWKVLP
ncbi:hypothetical protein ACFQBQ_01380 [Granulicella cerasi]|uniref:SGNH hydrolase-type esterase domain-containing protein n=1 Tax=Granulicella cerasi TaxID=741063 RepID=A0ABW1Z4E6_9BACT|nr:SGNH/GDSL hydrolase family protein [Granulicella cerasi]